MAKKKKTKKKVKKTKVKKKMKRKVGKHPMLGAPYEAKSLSGAPENKMVCSVCANKIEAGISMSGEKVSSERFSDEQVLNLDKKEDAHEPADDIPEIDSDDQDDKGYI